MLFALFYTFVADHNQRRLPYREAHLAHAQAFAKRGELLLGGAFGISEQGALSVFASLGAARAFAEADPYVQAGLVGKWEVREWEAGVGAWVGRE